MLWGGSSDNGSPSQGLELRLKSDGTARIKGRFPYNSPAVLSDGGRTGRPRKEIIASRAFAYRVERPEKDIHFLSGHDYAKPIASRGAGTLDLKDTEDALLFEATVSPEMQEVSYVKDFLAALSAGLVSGISPGFRIPPKRRVENAESVEDEGSDPEKGEFNALIRTVHAALLYEISAVTRPAYPDTQIEERNWGSHPVLPKKAIQRWRA